MRIRQVQVDLVPIAAVSPPFRWRDGLPGSDGPGISGILRIQTDEGIEGVVPAVRGPIVADLVERRLRDELVGQDPLRREWIWHRLWELDRVEEFPIYIQGLVDAALWDIAGKQVGQPLHQLAWDLSHQHCLPMRAPSPLTRSPNTWMSSISVWRWGIPRSNCTRGGMRDETRAYARRCANMSALRFP